MELAMQIILCLLIAALIGGIIGFLLGKMSKCDNDDYEYGKKDELNDYSKDFVDEVDSELDVNNLGGVNKTLATTAGIGAVSSSVFAENEPHDAIGQEIGVRPSSLQAPINGEADDLKEISGIGLKIEDTLQGLGIFNFQQIAQWSGDNVDWIENYLAFKGRVKKEDWIGQAKLLSAGGQTEFSKKVRRGDNQNY
jgi:predicted flap endonuclease-1-like 5' DNA nuclease